MRIKVLCFSLSTQSKAHSLWCPRLRNTEEKNHCNCDPYLRHSIDSVRAECVQPVKDSVGKCNQYHLKARDIQKECDLRSRMTETFCSLMLRKSLSSWIDSSSSSRPPAASQWWIFKAASLSDDDLIIHYSNFYSFSLTQSLTWSG